MKKRLFSILLSCCMALTLLPTTSLADQGREEIPLCICQTACTKEQLNEACPVCGAENAALTDCSQCTLPEDGSPEVPAPGTPEDDSPEAPVPGTPEDDSPKAPVPGTPEVEADGQLLEATLPAMESISSNDLTPEVSAAGPADTYDLADGSIAFSVNAKGVQAVTQGGTTTYPAGTVTIIQTGSETPTREYNITVTAAAGQTAYLVLSGVNIYLGDTGGFLIQPYSVGIAAMETYGKGNVTLELDGTNYLLSGECRAGLEKHNTGMLTLQDENAVPGSLKAVGNGGGAGIGGVLGYFKDLNNSTLPGYPWTPADSSVGNITIISGTIEASSYASLKMYGEDDNNLGYGAGIGGGVGGSARNITINGGQITAKSGSGAGIGGGAGGTPKYDKLKRTPVYGNADTLIINGGQITATTTSGGAAIGGGKGSSGKNITINDGMVTANGSSGGAGIGGGSRFDFTIGDEICSNGINITINGGTVIASGGTYSILSKDLGVGAGIGGGSDGNGEYITINGGKVTATGGTYQENTYYPAAAAGIGGGSDGNGINIEIRDGEVTATGGTGYKGGGAGIGGGAICKQIIGGIGENIFIYGGSVTATGGTHTLIDFAHGSGGGAGIGGGGGYRKVPGGSHAGKNIIIYGGTVMATGNDGAGIGGGYTADGTGIQIRNGDITARTDGLSAGIGGGREGNGIDITILGGKVTATAGNSAAIGGGIGGDGRNITIKNGEIIATAPGEGAGIGGGNHGNGEDITIENGKVTATSMFGAGIGGGAVYSITSDTAGKGNGRRITIKDGEVSATSEYGAGIGGGQTSSGFEDGPGVGRNYIMTPSAELGCGNGEDITIKGGIVTATSASGAGIGGGRKKNTMEGHQSGSRYDCQGRNITIEGGIVTAKGGTGGTGYRGGGAGIGGGQGGDAVNITIKGGIVTATSGKDSTESYYCGAGIGGGGFIYGGNAKGITITGGTVIATGASYISEEGGEYSGGAGIGGGGGRGYGGGDAEDITITGGTVIATGGRYAAGIGGGKHGATPDSYTRIPVLETEDNWNPRPRAGCVKNITISGGTVTAIGQDTAAGIGGGGFYYGSSNTDTDFGTDPKYGKYNPQLPGGCAENITITGGYITARGGGNGGADIGRSVFDFAGRVSTETGLSASGGTFYRSIPDSVEIDRHVVQFQVGDEIRAWQVVRHRKQASLPGLTDENGVSLDQWYHEDKTYRFKTPVTAGLTLTAKAHTCDGWRTNADSHWHYCTDCRKVIDKAAHSFGSWVVTRAATTIQTGEKVRTCSVCGYEHTAPIPSLEDSGHQCVYDRRYISPDALKTAADCTRDAVYYKSCSCGIISSTETFTAAGTKSGHNWAADWSKDADSHWHECTRCHEKNENAAHDYGEATHCQTCGYDRTHTHSLTLVSAKENSCTEAGNKAYYICSGCDSWFEDAGGTTQITDKTVVFLAATGHQAEGSWQSSRSSHWMLCDCGMILDRTAHSFGSWTVTRRSTVTQNGEKKRTCSVCTYTETKKIPAAGDSHSGSSGGSNNNNSSNSPEGSSGNNTSSGGSNGSHGSNDGCIIQVTAGINGSISPSGDVSLQKGQSQTFFFTPDKGYAICDVKIDGRSIGAVKSYTFERIANGHSIEVLFMKADGNPQTGVLVDMTPAPLVHTGKKDYE